MINALRKIAKIHEKIESLFLMIFFSLTFLLILSQVISRFVFKNPIIWTDEATTMLQMWIAFLGIGYGIRTKRHIKLDGLYNRFPEWAQYTISILFNLAFIFVTIIMIKSSLKYIRTEWRVFFGTFPIPFRKGAAFLAFPIGYGLAAFYTVLDTVDYVLRLLNKPVIFNFHKES